MTCSATAPWQKRRTAFNHDWLKNRFLPALAKWINLLDDRLEDLAFQQSFVATVLPQWEGHRAEASALPRNFAVQMSPRSLLGARRDTWLGLLVHFLWLNRYPVFRWVQAATARANEAEEAYQRLRARLATCADTTSAAALWPLRRIRSVS